MTHNNITGDKIATKLGSDEAKRNFDDGFDLIFGKKEPKGYTAEELERDNPYNQWMYDADK
jgi:hypothetical protein